MVNIFDPNAIPTLLNISDPKARIIGAMKAAYESILILLQEENYKYSLLN